MRFGVLLSRRRVLRARLLVGFGSVLARGNPGFDIVVAVAVGNQQESMPASKGIPTTGRQSQTSNLSTIINAKSCCQL